MVLAALATKGVCAQDATRENDCQSNTSCDECLGDSCAWLDGSFCMAACMISDTPCFTMDSFTGATSVAEVCQVSADYKADGTLCSGHSDCGSCVGSVLSDGVSTCSWIEEAGMCTSDCTMLGCGEKFCAADAGLEEPATPAPTVVDTCEPRTSCEECLSGEAVDFFNTGSPPKESCGWIPGYGCIANCHMIADVECYANTTRLGALEDGVDNSVEAICGVVADNVADSALCSQQNDCASCTTTTLLDGESTCHWFATDELGLKGFCGRDHCTMIGCGETTCTAAPENAMSGVAAGAAPSPPSDIGAAAPPPPADDNVATVGLVVSGTCETRSASCGECLGPNPDGSPSACAWVPAMGEDASPCVDFSCDMIADTRCYSLASPVTDILATTRSTNGLCDIAAAAAAAAVNADPSFPLPPISQILSGATSAVYQGSMLALLAMSIVLTL